MSRVYLAVPIIENRNLNKAQLLSKTIEDTGHMIVSVWVTKTDPGFTMTPQGVFERDTQGVKECDILVAEVSDRSHGVGMEMMLAHTQGKKVICLFKKGTVVSKMILGLPDALLIEYGTEKEMVEKLKEILEKLPFSH